MKFLPDNTVNNTKPLFIYLPGMDGSGKLFENQINIWDNFDVRCLHIPPQKMGWQELTNRLIGLIKQELSLKQGRKLYICGESFGACLALKLIESIPHLFEHVILINSASGFLKRPFLHLGIPLTQMMSDGFYHNSTMVLLPFLGKLEAIPNAQRKKLLQAMREVPPQIVSWRLNLLKNFQYQPPPSHPPLLIIASAQDQLLPSVSEAHELKQKFPEANIKILKRSGHCCLLEEQIDLCQIIGNG